MRKVSSIQAEWTPQELFYKLFCDKICPACSGTLDHYWHREYVGKQRGFGGQGPRETDQFFDRYTCLACGRDYGIAELVEERNKRRKELKCKQKEK